MTDETPIEPLPGEGPPQSVPPPATTPPPPTDSDTAVSVPSQERTMAMLCHLTALVALVGVPFGNIIGPLVVWLVKRDEFPLVADQGKESLNFQISITIYLIVSVILWLVLVGIVLTIALAVAWLVLVIVASVKANEGIRYRYPLTIRFIN